MLGCLVLAATLPTVSVLGGLVLVGLGLIWYAVLALVGRGKLLDPGRCGRDNELMSSAAVDTAYRWGHLREADVGAWAELVNLLAVVDGTDETFEPPLLAEELREHGVDPTRDTWAVWQDDTLVGWGQVRVAFTAGDDGRTRVWIGGGVHPDHRGRGIGRRLVALQEERGLTLARERRPGHPAFWRADGGLDGASVRRLLEHRGYEVVRYFNQMVRPLPGEPVGVPADLRLVTPEDHLEEPLRRAHNLAFRDHWGSTEQTAELWHDHWVSAGGRLDVSTVALDEKGEPLAYVLCGEYAPEELYVNIVGTVPTARGRGLAKACLARTITLAAESGRYARVDLHVDSASPTGATRVYEAVGFTLDKTFASYQRDA
jgi:mycothiol synthase